MITPQRFRGNPWFYRTNPSSINERYAKAMGKSWLGNQDSKRRLRIKDLPVMIKADGTIVCIPRQPEQGVTALIGMPGKGKTLLAGYILDNIFWNWKDYIAVVNDSQEESFDWSEPCENKDFIKRLAILKQTPMPLPMIYLFPKMYDAKDDLVYNKDYVFISLPFREVINNVEKMLNLGNSEKYLMAKRDELLKAESEKDIISIIESINTGTKGMAEATGKILASFQELINEGILNVSDPSVPAYLNVGKYTGNPFTAIMLAECIPAFITSDLYTQKYKDAIFSYYINGLFYESLKGEMKGKRVWLYFDELTRVVSADVRYTCPESEKALNNVVARGRNNGISLIYATQRYRDIPKSIRELTKYSIVFRHNSKEETKEICDDFGLDSDYRIEILSLKKFEVMVFTNEHLICYKRGKTWETSEPQRGYIIPAMHKNRFLQEKKK